MSLECRVMILDDEESIRFSLREILERNGYRVQAYGDPYDALAALGSFKPRIVVADYSLPKLDGLEFMGRVHQRYPEVMVIFMTAYGTEELAVEAMKRGAYDYFKKPFRNDAVLVSIAKAREKLELVEENRRLRDEARDKGRTRGEFVGESEAVREVFDTVERIADTEVTVLLQGESGTGKELIASALHRASGRRDRPFVRLNCAAIPETLVESELFGYERGAFSGANRDYKGKFEQADGGTIFLDEIGDMSLATQTKVLRVLQEKEVQRLGSGTVLHVDVRILAATHQDLGKLAARGQFREDLYFRLNVMALRIPPLRERPDDVPRLVRHFLQLYREKFGEGPEDLDPAIMERFVSHPWPGNVRELENTIARGVLLGSFEGLPASSLEPRAGESVPPGQARPGRSRRVLELPDHELDYRDAKRELLDRFDEVYLGRLLEEAGGNVSKAARMAGMHRKNFYEKIQRLGLGEGE